MLSVQVMSFFDRKLYTWCFLILGILASSCVAIFIQASSALAVYVWLSCWFLSLFTLMPAEIPENNNLVYASLADNPPPPSFFFFHFVNISCVFILSYKILFSRVNAAGSPYFFYNYYERLVETLV